MVTSPRVAARSLRARFDAVELRQARQLVRELREAPPDVLYFGDSTNFAFHVDGDIRQTGVMLQEQLAPLRVSVVAAGGMHPAIVQAYVELVALTSVRPVVAMSTSVRMHFDAWLAHPTYSYAREMAALQEVDPAGPLYRIRLSRQQPTADEWRAYEGVRQPTLLGDLTVAEYLAILRDPDMVGTPEWVRWLYAYHHTARPGDLGLGRMELLARRLRDLGIPTVLYLAPICVERGRELFGAPFERIVQENADAIAGRFMRGLDGLGTVLRTEASFAAAEFVDPDDGSEHLRGAGREELARLVAEQVRRVLASSTSEPGRAG